MNRTDLICEKNIVLNRKDFFNNIEIDNYIKNNFFYKVIHFSILNNELKMILKKELLSCINKNISHVFIVGLGNDNHTADSIGPKCLKYIRANSYLDNLGVVLNSVKISSLEPGSLAETGINTKKVIESVIKEIKPDFIILIDSYVSNDIKYLNKCIQITNEGITPGSGLVSINSHISFETIGVPILVIGVPTAIEIKKSNQSYFLSTKDVDDYVINISKIIGEAINEVLYHI